MRRLSLTVALLLVALAGIPESRPSAAASPVEHDRVAFSGGEQRKAAVTAIPASDLPAEARETLHLIKEQFLRHAANSMHFPEYFGNNWDAFQDCATDMSWHEADGFVILYAEPEPFLDSAPGEFNLALDIFREACDYGAARTSRGSCCSRAKREKTCV